MRAIPSFLGDGPEGESLLHGFLHRLPTGLLEPEWACGVRSGRTGIPEPRPPLLPTPLALPLSSSVDSRESRSFLSSLVKVAVDAIL